MVFGETAAAAILRSTLSEEVAESLEQGCRADHGVVALGWHHAMVDEGVLWYERGDKWVK